MDTIVTLVTEHPIIGIGIMIVAVMLIISIVKSLFKVAMVVTVIGLVLVVFFGFKPQEVIDKGKDLTDTGTTLFEDNSDTGLLGMLSKENFLITEENGQTILEIKSLGVKYNVDDLLSKLDNEKSKELEQIIEK
ncbi:hypothetical protein [Aquibacillus rhizosphaerae]|uniref:Uncharacterized protein n=1 Tax=Aquibacillus rhizosphaerae TaxID=3051431 RepID=A0ABT7LCD5_9BACI|nr:hypothetical protein [Aquibacillus sp. LR5S19]MDL4842855.1 hypothetical protein [Aquibacillus sp. LR5S19]